MSERASGNGKSIAIRVVVVAVLVAAVGFAIRYYSRSETEVRTARADFHDIISSASTNGKVEPVRNFQAHASDPGTVQAVYVHAGQQVAAGTLLLKMDSAAAAARVETARSSLAQAQAANFDLKNGGSRDEKIALNGDVDRASLQVAQAQKDLAALQALQAQGAASASEVASAQQRLASAKSSLATLQQRSTSRYAPTDKQRVQAQLSDSQANLSAAEDSLSKAVVRAPFAGTVYSLPVKAYDFVGGGEELVQMADLSKIQVRAYFDEPEIGKLRVGDPVVIRWDARPTQEWHGHIVRTPTTVINYGTRYVGECLIAVDDATGDLLPNTNVTVYVTTQQVFHVLALPREALHTDGDENFVYVVSGDQLVKRVVKVGALNLSYVEIKSGIQPNEQVALSALSSSVDLSEGLRVKVAPR